MQNQIYDIQLKPIDSEVLSFEEYETADKSNIKRADIVPCNPYDISDFGGVRVFYVIPIWR